MKIDNELLKKLEKLSSLEIAEDKRDGMINQLSEIVEFIENCLYQRKSGLSVCFGLCKTTGSGTKY